MTLDGKNVAVTGASSGIGRQIAIEFADEGANVGIGDIREQPKEEGEPPTAEVVRDRGQDALFCEADVSDPAECEAFIEATVAEFGGLDVLVNNAGTFLDSARGKAVDELSHEEWNAMIDINLTGAFSCSKFALPYICESDAGRVINIASKMGLVGHPTSHAYAAAKAGVVLLSKAMAMDHAPHEVTVNAICPGIIRTGNKPHRFEIKGDRMREGTPLPFFGEPVDVARAAVFLASEDARFITGHALPVDGGWTAR